MVSQAAFNLVATGNPDELWELLDGVLGRKPAMSVSHNRLMTRLCAQLFRQIDVDEFEVRMNTGRLSSSDQTYFIPDVHVVPVALIRSLVSTESMVEILSRPMPFVVEVWSPSTGEYDVDRKVPEYKTRGDLEIWRLHPYDRTLTVWLLRDGGGYDESIRRGGVVQLVALPGVSVDLDQLFDLG